MKREISVILHNIRSVHNVGSIFRTSDAVSVDNIYLSGYTPGPLDRFGKARRDLAKSALGAENLINWQNADISIINNLKKQGFFVIALEQSNKSIDYKKVNIKGKNKILFILGNEVRGLDKRILKKADITAEIPMGGRKESLNVSVAFGIAVFRILNI